MTTTQKRNLMIEAHKMAKKMVGDYQARLALALRKAWQKIKNRREAKDVKRLVVADWWLEKNPAKDVILNEFEELEITQETEKAVLLNSKFWVPKSVIEEEEVSEEEINEDEIVDIIGGIEDTEERRELTKEIRRRSGSAWFDSIETADEVLREKGLM